MGRFYGLKIRNQEINPNTGAVWTVDDVPKLWRNASIKWLADNA